MNSDILIERIEYLSSMPHSVLVEHCIYLENENDNYKAQKYITDFISENSIICEKNKEIERLNNIINELEKDMREKYHKEIDYQSKIMQSDLMQGDYPVAYYYAEQNEKLLNYYLNKLKELKGE